MATGTKKETVWGMLTQTVLLIYFIDVFAILKLEILYNFWTTTRFYKTRHLALCLAYNQAITDVKF